MVGRSRWPGFGTVWHYSWCRPARPALSSGDETDHAAARVNCMEAAWHTVHPVLMAGLPVYEQDSDTGG